MTIDVTNATSSPPRITLITADSRNSAVAIFHARRLPRSN